MPDAAAPKHREHGAGRRLRALGFVLVLGIGRLLATLTGVGVEPTAIVPKPADWTTIELARDSTQRYLLGDAPTTRPPRTLWDLPVVTSVTMQAGKALVGDFRNAAVMDRQAIEVVAFESGMATEASGSGGTAVAATDLATRNLFKLRGELRAAPLVQLPAAFKVAILA